MRCRLLGLGLVVLGGCRAAVPPAPPPVPRVITVPASCPAPPTAETAARLPPEAAVLEVNVLDGPRRGLVEAAVRRVLGRAARCYAGTGDAFEPGFAWLKLRLLMNASRAAGSRYRVDVVRTSGRREPYLRCLEEALRADPREDPGPYTRLEIMLLGAGPAEARCCRRSQTCAKHGACTPGPTGCEAVTAADCRQSTGCLDAGRCTAGPGACVVRGDADCAASTECASRGRCVDRWGACAPTAESCLRSRGCQARGECSLVDERCAVGSDADCQRSEVCREQGQCSRHRDGWCVARTRRDCERSNGCRDQGTCTPTPEGDCVVGSNADCAGSARCRSDGECTRVDEDTCAPRRDSECARSTACREEGLCRYHHDGMCVTAEDLRNPGD